MTAQHSGGALMRIVERHAALLSAATLVKAQGKPTPQGIVVPPAAWRILATVLDEIEGKTHE